MSDAPNWLNTDAAAKYLGIVPAMLHKLVLKGEIVGYRIGRVRRFRQEDLDCYLDEARIKPDVG